MLIMLLANDNHNNYSLDLSTDPSVNLIYNTIHVCKIKCWVNNDFIVLPQRQLAKPGLVLQHRYEVKKVMEYCKGSRTSVLQY